MRLQTLLMTLLITALSISVGNASPPTTEQKSNVLEKDCLSFNVAAAPAMEFTSYEVLQPVIYFAASQHSPAMIVDDVFIPLPFKKRYFIVDERLPDHPKDVGWLDKRINYKYYS